MASLVSNLANNTSEDTMIKKCETCGIKYNYCHCFLEYANFKNDLIE